MEITAENLLGRGLVLIPIHEYEELNDQLKSVIKMNAALSNDNEELRELFADLSLPSPDVIDKGTIDIDERVSPIDPTKRRRRIEFTYNISL